MIDIQELKNCQENNSIGYIVWALPQIIKEIEALREVAEAAREEQYTDPPEGCACYVCPGCRNQKSAIVDALKKLDKARQK